MSPVRSQVDDAVHIAQVKKNILNHQTCGGAVGYPLEKTKGE